MTKDDLILIWKKFTKNNDFQLNPDAKLVDGVADSVLANEQKYGLKLCPCRMRDGSRQRDLELICPCNFKAQDVWTKLGRCTCGLFVKR